MKIQTKILVKRISAEGEENLRTVSEDVQVADGSSERFRSMAELSSRHAHSCIYCASTDQLSSEHIVPYAWGGTVQIHDGSCEECRKITSAFENFALNDGAMAHVRKALGLPSRSRHKSASVPVAMEMEGSDGQPLIMGAEAVPPVLLGFPLFVRPGLLTGDGTRVELGLEGMAAAAFGDDLASFLASHSAVGATQEESSKRIMAFARTIAKIAYGWAWRDGVIERLGGTAELVDAFMRRPERLGAFVGTKPSPYERFAGLQLRIEYKLAMPRQLVYLEVQMFAEAAVPTYEVVLGRVESMRAWRTLRQNFCR